MNKVFKSIAVAWVVGGLLNWLGASRINTTVASAAICDWYCSIGSAEWGISRVVTGVVVFSTVLVGVILTEKLLAAKGGFGRIRLLTILLFPFSWLIFCTLLLLLQFEFNFAVAIFLLQLIVGIIAGFITWRGLRKTVAQYGVTNDLV